MFNSRRMTNILLAFIAMLMSIILLKLAEDVVLPLVLACFLSMMLHPVLKWMNRRLPFAVSLILILLVISVFMIIDTMMFVVQLNDIVNKISTTYLPLLKTKFDVLSKSLDGYGVHLTWEQLGTKDGIQWMFGFLQSGVRSMLSVFGQMFLVILLIVFALMETKEFRYKIAVKISSDSSEAILDTFSSIAKQIQFYALNKTWISVLTGVFTSAIAYMIGIDFAFFWGVLALLLNFIPNVGSIIAVIPPTMLAFVQFPSAGPGLVALISLTVVQTIMGNIVEPKVMGHSLHLSTLVIFLSMIFWGWMWGILGMVLAVPMTVSIKIICEHIDDLKPIAALLGDLSDDPFEPSPEQLEAVENK